MRRPGAVRRSHRSLGVRTLSISASVATSWWIAVEDVGIRYQATVSPNGMALIFR